LKRRELHSFFQINGQTINRSDIKGFLTENFVAFKLDANASKMVPILKTKTVIDENDVAIITREKRLLNKNEMMVKAIVKVLDNQDTDARHVIRALTVACKEAKCSYLLECIHQPTGKNIITQLVKSQLLFSFMNIICKQFDINYITKKQNECLPNFKTHLTQPRIIPLTI